MCVPQNIKAKDNNDELIDTQMNSLANQLLLLLGRSVDQSVSRSVDQPLRLVSQQFINGYSYSISNEYMNVVIQLVLPAGANPFCNYRLPVATCNYNYLLK